MHDRRALVVGIDHYQQSRNDLRGAVADAEAIAALLGRHADGTLNYECRLLADRLEAGQPIARSTLREACQELFSNFTGDILFYFSGHGVLTSVGGYLCTQDALPNDWGVPMDDIVSLSSSSSARDILDHPRLLS